MGYQTGCRPQRPALAVFFHADGHAVFQQLQKPKDEKRMVIILQPDQYDAWLTCAPDDAPSFFTRYPADRLLLQPAPKGQQRVEQTSLI